MLRRACGPALAAARVEYVDIDPPEFAGNFYKPKESNHAKKQKPLKSFDDYMKMDVDELKKLHDIRSQQIYELKQLHERAHRNVEYFYRKQALDYDERALNYGEAAGSLVMDQISYHRVRLGELRQKDWTFGRDKGIALWACGIVTVLWWFWLLAHYPKKPTLTNKGTLGSTSRILNNPFTTDQRWLGKNVLTAWEKDQLEKNTEMFPNGPPKFKTLDLSINSSGFYLHEKAERTKPNV
jgi:hypothetical protein